MNAASKVFKMEMMFKERDYWTLNKMLEYRAQTHGDKIFLQYKEESPLTFKYVHEITNKIANGLSGLGIKKGDNVLVFLPNCLEFIYTWFALSKIGAVQVPVNTAYKGYFLDHISNNSMAKIMVVDQEFTDRVKNSEDNLKYLEKIIISGLDKSDKSRSIPSRFTISDYKSLYNNPSGTPVVEVSYKDNAAIMYTSGTTGPSKGVALAHAWMHVMAERMIAMFHITKEDTYLLYLPLFHGNAQAMIVMTCLISTARVVIYEKFSASGWVDMIRKSNASLTNLVGVMMDAVFRQAEKNDDNMNNLRGINAYPCPSAIVESFKKRFGVTQMLEAYGMTETGLITLMPFGDYRADSCGKIAGDFVEAIIADPETDEELPVGHVGELLVRPKIPWTLNSGYYKMPDKTTEAYRNAWFHTGDGLKVDQDGYYYFVDRIKDALRKGGENISSFEVEKMINDHPAVAESAVVAVKSESCGGEDEVKACIVLNVDHNLTYDGVLSWCDDKLPRFCVPRYIEFVEALPKTPTEKVMKGKIRDQGVTLATYDRVAAGYKLKEEIKRDALKKQ
ncbi:MAG TPA: ATP-dependent acyl-CoA ligase [Desulfobacteraceae bacterium]|nr:ATP-dependent acyl-CoA ligase [Desulfobacteraceae bacterium]